MRLPRPAMDRIISPRLGLDLDLRVMQMAAAGGHPWAWVLRKVNWRPGWIRSRNRKDPRSSAISPVRLHIDQPFRHSIHRQIGSRV